MGGFRPVWGATAVVLSRTAGTHASDGRHLVATSVIGPSAPAAPAVRAELARGALAGGWRTAGAVLAELRAQG